MHSTLAASLLAFSLFFSTVVGSPVTADVLSSRDVAETADDAEGDLFVPSLEEHEAHLMAIMGDSYTPDVLTRDSLANPQFTADHPFTEEEMEFLGDEDDDYLDDEAFDLEDDSGAVNGTNLEARQTPCGQWTPATRPAPQKQPRNDFFHKQLTRKVVCGNGGGCDTSRETSRTFTFGWSSEIAATWISAGFNVAKSVTTGNQVTCKAPAGSSVCLWKRVLHTSYRVRNGRFNTCTGFEATSAPFRMRSPNKDAPRTVFYCVRGDACRGIGDGYWQTGV